MLKWVSRYANTIATAKATLMRNVLFSHRELLTGIAKVCDCWQLPALAFFFYRLSSSLPQLLSPRLNGPGSKSGTCWRTPQSASRSGGCGGSGAVAHCSLAQNAGSRPLVFHPRCIVPSFDETKQTRGAISGQRRTTIAGQLKGSGTHGGPSPRPYPTGRFVQTSIDLLKVMNCSL